MTNNAWENIETAESEFLVKLADEGGLDPLVSGMLRHCARLLTPTERTPQRDGDGMLHDLLMPHAKEWYALCERRFGATRIGISGELAEAIVEVIGLSASAARSGGDAELRALLDDLMIERQVKLYFSDAAQERIRVLHERYCLQPNTAEED